MVPSFLNVSSEPRSVSLQLVSGAALSVEILGPAQVRADTSLKLKAKSLMCGGGNDSESSPSKFTVCK